MASYETHDNGGRPFRVDVSPTTVSVTVQSTGKSAGQFAVQRTWVGADPLRLGPEKFKPWMLGNSVFAELTDGRYLFVGDRVFTFSPMKGDSIDIFQSYVGNSDVPYPYAISNTHTYLMLLDKGKVIVLPNEHLDLKRDVYAQYYGGLMMSPVKKLLPVKLLHDRLAN